MANEQFYSPALYEDSFCVQKEVRNENEVVKYWGFGKSGVTSLAEAKFAICRFHTDLTTGITTKMWVNGTKTMEHPFLDVENKNYQFLK